MSKKMISMHDRIDEIYNNANVHCMEMIDLSKKWWSYKANLRCTNYDNDTKHVWTEYIKLNVCAMAAIVSIQNNDGEITDSFVLKRNFKKDIQILWSLNMYFNTGERTRADKESIYKSFVDNIKSYNKIIQKYDKKYLDYKL